jgi:hypothetical protein
MTPRYTSTGAVLETMILPALARGGDAAVTVRRYLTFTYLRKLWAATSAE